MSTIMSTACGIELALRFSSLAKKNNAQRHTSWMYIPTKTWVMALGKNRPPVSDPGGWSYTQMNRYLYTSAAKRKKHAPKPLITGEMTMYATTANKQAAATVDSLMTA